MNLEYIKAIIKDIEEVLSSTESILSETDCNKLTQAKIDLEENLANQINADVSIEDKTNYLQILIMIIEIIKSISDHWK